MTFLILITIDYEFEKKIILTVYVGTIFGFLFPTEFNLIACDLRLDEHTDQMYVFTDITSSGRHVIYKDHI